MTTSPNGRKLIESFEGLRTVAYLPTPHDVPTIGYGHTEGVQMGDTCTAEQADEYLADDLLAAEAGVSSSVLVDINQNQFDALVSFVFNVGGGNFHSSTLRRLLNNGDYQGAADQFLVWNKQAGQVLPGLTNRRTAERAFFLTEAQ